MEKKTDKNFIDPVVDQQVIKQKKGKGLWWLLLIIIIVLLAIWFSTHKNNQTADISPSSSAIVTQGDNSSTDANKVQPAPESAENQSTDSSAFAKLQTYYAGDKTAESAWIDLNQVSFATGSAAPEISDTPSLTQVAELVAQHPDNTIIIRGFTDNTGTDNINKPLSDQRANAIKNWLTQHGVKDKQVSIEGQGADHAVADNQTAQGRNQNRRVAIQVKSAS